MHLLRMLFNFCKKTGTVCRQDGKTYGYTRQTYRPTIESEKVT